jgi:hypothetical protein
VIRWRTVRRVAATVFVGLPAAGAVAAAGVAGRPGRSTPPAAARAARAVQWPAYSPGRAAPIQRSRPAPADVVPGADADRHAAAGGLSCPWG